MMRCELKSAIVIDDGRGFALAKYGCVGQIVGLSTHFRPMPTVEKIYGRKNLESHSRIAALLRTRAIDAQSKRLCGK